jgi:hypothetical protein
MPAKEDFTMQANVCEHTDFVANVASSWYLILWHTVNPVCSSIMNNHN